MFRTVVFGRNWLIRWNKRFNSAKSGPRGGPSCIVLVKTTWKKRQLPFQIFDILEGHQLIGT
jgi:hypothetical protein